jgi:hypothetical protein
VGMSLWGKEWGQWGHESVQGGGLGSTVCERRSKV